MRVYHAELVFSRIAPLSLPDVGPSARSRAVSCSRSCALLVRSGCMRFLAVFGSVTSKKHMPTGAFPSVPMTISRSTRCMRPEPGQAHVVVSVSDDVMEPGRCGVVRSDRDEPTTARMNRVKVY